MGDKNVSVTIVGDDVVVDKPCLRMGKSKDQKIEWTIDTPGWTFPDNGIEFKVGPSYPDPGDQFSEGGKVSGHDNKFKWKDKNSDGKTYYYNVHVTNGTKNLSLDPTIVNEV